MLHRVCNSIKIFRFTFYHYIIIQLARIACCESVAVGYPKVLHEEYRRPDIEPIKSVN